MMSPPQPQFEPLTQAEHVRRGAAFLAHRCRKDSVMLAAAMEELGQRSWAEACNSFLLTADEILRQLAIATGRPADDLAQEIAAQAALACT